MFSNPAWTVDATRVLTRRQLATVLADARKQAERSLNAQRNLIIVRLACCCGLRVSEIGALRLDDGNVDGAPPHGRIWPSGRLSCCGTAPAAAIRSSAAF